MNIPLFKIYTDANDVAAVSSVLTRGSYWATGPEIEALEKDLAAYLGVPYVLTFNSGTSALYALLSAHDISGGEVIIPSFTFIATANAVIQAGGKPVFAESEDATFGLDIADVKKKITPNTKAIVPLHYGGLASRDTKALHTLCKEKGILLLADAAESFGSSIDGTKLGHFSDGSMFSFCQNKVITCGEGGIAVTHSEEIYEKMKLFRSHGRFEDGQDYFSSIDNQDYLTMGYNFRMATMQAVLLASQLKKIETVTALRKKHAAFLTEQLEGISGLRCPVVPDGLDHLYQMFTLLLDDHEKRDGLQNYLQENGIMSKVYFTPVHLMTFFQKQGWKEGDLPFTELLSKRVLTIPCYPTMTQEELDYLVESIRTYFLGEDNDE